MSDKRSLSSYDTGHTVRRPVQVAKPSSNKSGPSLMGLLSSRRFVNKLKARKQRSNETTTSNTIVNKEPTYRMEPMRRFNTNEVLETVQEFVDDRLSGYRYIPKFGKNLASVLADEVKDKVKCMNYERYKIVCSVILGEIRNQDLMVSSRCTWQTDTDNSVIYTYKTKQYFCNVSVYGIYAE